ncbi:MAG: hypothetical protein K8R58_09520 [Bacteroidales bacterium]|nr:hypothetical protein [Bacteroidales bacterium]
MVFSSSLFLLYFLPLFLIIYYLLDKNFKNIFTLLASIFFYTWGAPEFIFIVLGSITIDYYIVNALYGSPIKKKRILLAISIILNVGLLLYFKYANFFIENVNFALQNFGFGEIGWVKIALPIGISFFTFQKLTYSIDVYRNVHTPLKKVTDYAMYILMFPQLIAGPIVRFNEIADQIEDRSKHETIDNRLLGFYRFIIGLSKKVLIANVLGAEADKIFAIGYNDLSTSLAWIGIIAYSFQIYFDFSGYSDMAIGIGRMIGFKFPENFNNPYISQNITEFWKRWHITLSRFMRDYLYIPLGGNRVSKNRLYFNLCFVFLISGFWHGAAWNFLIWGAYHGIFLIADRIFLIKFTQRIGKYPSIIITYIIILVGWVFFRVENLPGSFSYISKMFTFDFKETIYSLNSEFISILIIGAFFSFIVAFKLGVWLQEKIYYTNYNLKGIISMSILSVILLFICISFITTSGFNPFIYFRF